MKAPPPRAKKPLEAPGSDARRIVEASFLASGAEASELPAPMFAEIAFAGRSNVGKSSLINALVERKNLVRTSRAPGATRRLNLFEARAKDGTTFHLMDLPGYGFARRSREERASWASFVEGYLSTRSTLAAVVLVIDARRGIEEDDRDLITFVESALPPSRRPVEVVVVATKCDKLAASVRRVSIERLKKVVGRKVVGFSSVTSEGRDSLWRELRRATLGDAGGGFVGEDAPKDLAPG